MYEMTFLQKVQLIKNFWSNEDNYTRFLPAREMYCPQLNGFGECDCVDNPDLDDIDLDLNTDWLLWEIELLED